MPRRCSPAAIIEPRHPIVHTNVASCSTLLNAVGSQGMRIWLFPPPPVLRGRAGVGVRRRRRCSRKDVTKPGAELATPRVLRMQMGVRRTRCVGCAFRIRLSHSPSTIQVSCVEPPPLPSPGVPEEGEAAPSGNALFIIRPDCIRSCREAQSAGIVVLSFPF